VWAVSRTKIVKGAGVDLVSTIEMHSVLPSRSSEAVGAQILTLKTREQQEQWRRSRGGDALEWWMAAMNACRVRVVGSRKGMDRRFVFGSSHGWYKRTSRSSTGKQLM